MLSLSHLTASTFHRYLDYNSLNYETNLAWLTESTQHPATVIPECSPWFHANLLQVPAKTGRAQFPGISNQDYGFPFRGLQINLIYY